MIKIKFELPNLKGNLIVKTLEEVRAFAKEAVKLGGAATISMADLFRNKESKDKNHKKASNDKGNRN